MLTINKPVQYGYRSVHDLPTPPSTSRPSPPLVFQDFVQQQKATLAIFRSSSPPGQSMSAPHRGLPPPAALTPVQPPSGSGPSQAPPLPPPPQSQSLGQFPAAPSWQHVSEESMRAWLLAKAEEEKRRQEEEKTRQESYRLEQRRMEHDILRTSLQGGIPPPMVPVVFAGMSGGVISQAALEWAQQYVLSQSQQQQHPPALMPPGPISPEHQRRDSQAQTYAQYPTSGGVPSTPGSGQGPPSAYMPGYPGSPTRPRGQSMPGPMGGRSHGGVSNLPSLNTNVPGGPGGPGATPSASHPGIVQSQSQPESQPSPSIYFHHWQPPASQGGGGGGARSGTDQPGTPSVGESPRKRKAPGPQPPVPPPGASQRLRSPPFSHSVGLSNPPPGRRRGHSRQRSDLGSYRAGGRGRGESGSGSFGAPREASPMHRDGGESFSFLHHQQQQHPQHQQQHPQQHQHQHQHQQAQGQGPQPQQARARAGAHSVSSLLSDAPQSPRATAQFAALAGPPGMRGQHGGEGDGRNSPRSLEEKARGGVLGSTATQPGDND